MNLKNYVLGLSAVAFMAVPSMAQTVQQKAKITKNYDIKKIADLGEQQAILYKRQRAAAIDYAKKHDIPMIVEKENGERSYLDRMDERGTLIYIKTFDKNSQITEGADRVHPGGGMDLQLQGEGMVAGVWDGGKVQEEHVLLEGQVEQMDNANTLDDHMTHVTGIIVGKTLDSGQGKLAEGIAPLGSTINYDWYNDTSELYSEAQDGLLVSNHSYGADISLLPQDNIRDYLGAYNTESGVVDNLTHLSPYLSVVTSAGNDRYGDNPIPEDGGYNILTGGMSTSKNTIVVAAIDKVEDYTGPNSVTMSMFSSWGPTKDFRVKPDISAHGVGVFSSVATTSTGAPSTTRFKGLNGTSMAGPNVAGGILLLQELSSDLTGNFLTSAEVRAIIFQTARQASETLGPDPRYGWGVLAVDKAAELMIDRWNQGDAYYALETLDEETTEYERTVTADGDELKVTIAWTDPKGSALQDDDDPVLVNDLDLRVTDSEGNTFYPWRLDPSDPAAPALNDGDNALDNVEQVLIEDAVEGEEYTISVTYKDELKKGAQDFAIALTGSSTLEVDTHKLNGFQLYPNPATDFVNLSLEKAGDQVEVAVYDINGRKVMTKQFNGYSNFDEGMDVSQLNSGVYFVKINTQGKNATQKLIVK